MCTYQHKQPAPQEGRYQQSTALQEGRYQQSIPHGGENKTKKHETFASNDCTSFSGNEKRKTEKTTINSRINFKNTISFRACPLTGTRPQLQPLAAPTPQEGRYQQSTAHEEQEKKNRKSDSQQQNKKTQSASMMCTYRNTTTMQKGRYPQSTAYYGDICEDQFFCIILHNKKRKTKKAAINSKINK